MDDCNLDSARKRIQHRILFIDGDLYRRAAKINRENRGARLKNRCWCGPYTLPVDIRLKRRN